MLAYDDDTTHPALTQETIKLFNRTFRDFEISSEDAEYIIQGSFDEDLETRWMQHYYDPVYNRGLTMFGKEWLSSKKWAQDTLAQARMWDKWIAGTFTSLFSSKSDFSWDRAIYEYAWGDKKRGLLALGHVLHLIQDASVPDHTRNDPHPPILDFGSPYEAWAKKFTRENFRSELNVSPTLLSNLNTHFDVLALYSNNNFFSKDTILNKEYAKPVVNSFKRETLSNGLTYIFAYSQDDYRLFRADKELTWYFKDANFYLHDPDNLILTDYWTRLSRQAVLHGAGVIKLFFDEVEKEKRTKALYEKNRSWIAKIWDRVTGFFEGFAGIWSSTQQLEQNSTADSTPGVFPSTPGVTDSPSLALPAEGEGISAGDSSVASLPQNDGYGEVGLPTGSPTSEAGQAPLEPSNQGLTGQVAGTTTTTTSTPSVFPSTPGVSDNNTGEIYPMIGVEVVPARANASPSPVLPAEGEGNGTSTPDVSTSTPGTVTDEAPEVTLAIRECDHSLSKETCLIATTTITLEWASGAEDLDYFIIGCRDYSGMVTPSPSLPAEDEGTGTPCKDFDISTTTATSTTYVAEGSPSTGSGTIIYTFSAKARDKNGNESETIFKDLKISTRPVVINEIAWAGTSARRAQDEWIELKNTTDVPIELVGMTLTSLTDGTPTIPLTGTIAPNGYYLIERTDDTTVSDIQADLITGFGRGSGAGAGPGLSNHGEVLAILYNPPSPALPTEVEGNEVNPLTGSGNIVIDRTPDIWWCGGWCGGGPGIYATMERYNPEAPGDDPTNWTRWQGFLGNGKNADGLAIQGTPGKRNSVNYMIDPKGNLNEDKFLKKSGSPYVIPSTFGINESVTLSIEPETVIKFIPHGQLNVRGKIIAKGAPEKPIIFTSLKDDEYGGDTNQDAASTTPQAGDWSAIMLGGHGSEFENVIIRYGGFYAPPGQRGAALVAQSAEFSMKKSIIEESGVYGAMLIKSKAELEENIFRNNGYDDPSGAGITAHEGELVIRRNKFAENNAGLFLTGGANPYSMEVLENSFIRNKGFAIRTLGARPNFSGNTAEGNGVNGIELQGAIMEDWTLKKDLPYVIFNIVLPVPEGKTITLEPGIIIKLKGGSAGLDIFGKLIVDGTPEEKIVFTSLQDDEFGDDTDGSTDFITGATSTAPQVGDWNSITFVSTTTESILRHAVLRYGTLGLRARGTPLAIEQSVVEKNKLVGIYLESAASAEISNSVIQNHIDDSPQIIRGLSLNASSTAIIRNTTFKNNEEHIFVDGTSGYTDGGGNVFE